LRTAAAVVALTRQRRNKRAGSVATLPTGVGYTAATRTGFLRHDIAALGKDVAGFTGPCGTGNRAGCTVIAGVTPQCTGAYIRLNAVVHCTATILLVICVGIRTTVVAGLLYSNIALVTVI